MQWHEGDPVVLAELTRAYAVELDARLDALADWFAAQLSVHAKATRPWTDRTYAAREGLFDVVDKDEARRIIDIYLSHGVEAVHGTDVDYGRYLETRWGGKYSVIMPTLRALLPELERKLQGLME